jgi:homoserine O-acetyltransferase
MSFTAASLSLRDDAVADLAWNAPAAFAHADERGERVVRLAPRYGQGAVDVLLRYRWEGAVGAPTVIVQGGISAGRDVAAAGEGWWADLVGSGRALDLRRWRVLSIDWLAAEDLGTVQAVSSEDQADALAALLAALGIERAAAFVGASYGAMVGLAFALRHPQRLGRLVAISGAHRAHPLATALRAIQREIVRAGLRSGATAPALALARQIAMTTYRGADEFAARFDTEPQFRDGRFHFAVEDYLAAAGEKFVARFDARRYLSLSESIDLHRIDPAALRVPATVVAVASDRLVPTLDLRALATAAQADYREIDSLYGHDAFLKEPALIGAVLRDALAGC